MLIKIAAASSGSNAALQALGLTKVALSPAQVKALSALAGGAIGGGVGALSDSEHRGRNALIGATGGALLGLGGAHLGLEDEAELAAAVAASTPKMPTVEEVNASFKPTRAPLDKNKAQAMANAAHARYSDPHNFIPGLRRITPEQRAQIVEEYTKVVQPLVARHTSENPGLTELYNSLPKELRPHPLSPSHIGGHRRQYETSKAIQNAFAQAIESGDREQYHYLLRYPDMKNPIRMPPEPYYTTNPLRLYGQDLYNMHDSALQNAVKKVLGEPATIHIPDIIKSLK